MRLCAPSHLDASPRRQLQSESTNIPDGVSLGRAMGLWVIAEGVDQHPQLHLHKVPKRYRIGCASTNIAQLCVLHTFPPSPKKEDSASLSPDTPSSGKRLQPTGPYSSHLCRTRVSAVFLFQHPTADHHGEPALHVDGPSPLTPGTREEKTSRCDSSSGGETDNEQRGFERTHWTDTVR